MKRHVVRMARLGGGSLLILAGVISGFLPVLQGWMFILAGLALMAPESRRAHALLEWAKRKAGRGDSEEESLDAGGAREGGSADGANAVAEERRGLRQEGRRREEQGQEEAAGDRRRDLTATAPETAAAEIEED